MALVVLIAAFLFGFVFAGFGGGSGSQGSATISPPKIERHHAVKCSARMGAGGTRKHCGGPPANP
jgi:hypothetical protein